MNFGELIEPNSRAFWNSYDEFDETNSQPAPVSWKWMVNERTDADIKSFKRLFIVEGLQICDFIQKTVLKKLSPVCQVVGYKMSVYQLDANANDYICVCEDNYLDQSAQITELLAPWLTKAEKVYLFPFQSAYTYNTDKKFDKHCFIRTISNAVVDVDIDVIAPMEDCNILNGISAGAATWRLIHNLPFTCFAVYMDCMEIDSLVGAIVLKVFRHLGLKCDTSYTVKAVNKSNLYM